MSSTLPVPLETQPDRPDGLRECLGRRGLDEGEDDVSLLDDDCDQATLSPHPSASGVQEPESGGSPAGPGCHCECECEEERAVGGGSGGVGLRESGPEGATEAL